MSGLGPWRYDTRGMGFARRHYAIRNNSAEPGSIEQIEFKSEIRARAYVRAENAETFRALNKQGDTP